MARGEMSTPAMDAALGFDKLGLPYYMPGWQQPSSVLDFLMRKDKWAALPASLRAQIQTACQANRPTSLPPDRAASQPRRHPSHTQPHPPRYSSRLSPLPPPR